MFKYDKNKKIISKNKQIFRLGKSKKIDCLNWVRKKK